MEFIDQTSFRALISDAFIIIIFLIIIIIIIIERRVKF